MNHILMQTGVKYNYVVTQHSPPGMPQKIAQIILIYPDVSDDLIYITTFVL